MALSWVSCGCFDSSSRFRPIFLSRFELRLFPSSAYQITYRRNSSNINAATVDVLSPSARQYTATGLKAELVYVFRLTAQTRKGWGEAAEALVVTTEKRGTRRGRPNVPFTAARSGLQTRLSPFSPTPAHQPPRSASGGSPGPQSAVVMGTGQRRPVPSSLLYSPIQRTARQQLDCPLCFSEPRVTLLHRDQVSLPSFYFLIPKRWESFITGPGLWLFLFVCFVLFFFV